MNGMNKFIICFTGVILLVSNIFASESFNLQTIESENNVRQIRYTFLSKHLETLSNEEITTLLSEGEPLHSGYGKSVKLQINGIPVFVKKVPLNSLEGNADNLNSTANLFKLPLYYQYGVGSAGFNVWREVSAHMMSTNCVLTNKTQNFPLVYH